MAKSQFKLLGDSPHIAGNDPLKFDELAGGLQELIQRAHSSTPLTLGVHAPWGMGKSSLMRRLEKRLKKEKNVSTVWFNAWTFEGEDVLEGLVKSVLSALDQNVLRKVLKSDKFKAVLKVVLSIVSRSAGIDKLVDDLWQHITDDPRARNEIQDVIKAAMDSWVEETPEMESGRLIAVFIDDLDRCSPENVFRVFEAIKLYLDAPGFVFVLGMDSEIISDAILEKKNFSRKITGRQYTEKVVQIDYTCLLYTSPSPRD